MALPRFPGQKPATLTKKADRRVTRSPGIEYEQVSVMRGGPSEHAVEVRWITMETGAKTGDTSTATSAARQASS
jgi:hypothetical protein